MRNFLKNKQNEMDYRKRYVSNRGEAKLNTLEWLVIDYHLNQVIENSFDVVYP